MKRETEGDFDLAGAKTLEELTERMIKKEIITTIRGHYDSLNHKDIKNAFEYFHPDNQPSKEVVEELEKLYRDYDIKISINRLEVKYVGLGEARVQYMQTTEKIKGPAFRDTIVEKTKGLAFRDTITEGEHTLKQTKEKKGSWKIYEPWKIYETKTTNTKYIN